MIQVLVVGAAFSSVAVALRMVELRLQNKTPGYHGTHRPYRRRK